MYRMGTTPGGFSNLNIGFAAGGPNDIGSVRKIQVLGPGKKPKTLDVYKYLQNPTVSQDFYLSENDYINVPVADRLISISGAINRPFQYELIEQENLKGLLKLAGGLKANALKGNIQVKRIENDSVRIIDIDYLTLERNGKDFTLLNGDSVQVQEINTNIRNEVYFHCSCLIVGRPFSENWSNASRLNAPVSGEASICNNIC